MQIKVKETKLHNVHIGGIKPFDNWDDVPVAEGELVIVESLIKNGWNEITHLPKLIIISKTDKIEVGDWVYNEVSKEIYCFKENLVSYEKKILVLPEHLSPQQLQDSVDGKLKEGKVLVETEHTKGEEDYYGHRIKLNPHITLHKVEQEMYTREEMKNILREFASYIDQDRVESPSIYRKISDQWFEQNVK